MKPLLSGPQVKRTGTLWVFNFFFLIFSVKAGLVFTSDSVGHNLKRRPSWSNENSPLIRLRSSELTRSLESQTGDLKPSIQHAGNEHCDLYIPTTTIWFSLDCKRGVVCRFGKMETFWLFRLRFRCAYWFSLGHNRSYNDSPYDSRQTKEIVQCV